jgi:hypothetical protein
VPLSPPVELLALPPTESSAVLTEPPAPPELLVLPCDVDPPIVAPLSPAEVDVALASSVLPSDAGDVLEPSVLPDVDPPLEPWVVGGPLVPEPALLSAQAAHDSVIAKNVNEHFIVRLADVRLADPHRAP